jgi:hypothetical protein
VERRPNTQTVQWFLESHASGQLVLDPPFQRRTVWSPAYRRFFIDTVLRNFPSPAVFIEWRIHPGEPTIYNVIDGKQRLSALIDFTSGEFHLGDLFANEGYDSPYWSDLAPELQRGLVNYVLTVENISDASDTDLRDAFDRLNRNVARLAAQELRHAQYPGVFLQRMESLAEGSFWTDKRIVTPANVRRMRDVEFVSELFLLTMHGVLDGAAHVLDEYYAQYDEEIPDEDEHRAAFDDVLGYIEELPLDWRRTRWRNMSDFYSLWSAVRALKESDELPDRSEAAARLTAFSDTQVAILEAERASSTLPGDDRDRSYFSSVRQGANKDTNRQTRLDVLVEVLRG